MDQATKVKWSLEADFLQACNCDYGCPCEFSAPPTKGFCEGMGVWRINRGKFGNTPLDGLSFGFAAHWPKALHEGNGTAVFFFDQRATAEQRDGLMKIVTGQEGGLPFEILATTVSTVLPSQYVPIEFNLNGRQSSVRLGDAGRISLEPIKNPVTKEPEDVRITHGTGFVFKEADCASGKECQVKVNGLTFSWPDKAAFVARVQYGN
jgi:hypothetical protein